jgi:hypothetical protein
VRVKTEGEMVAAMCLINPHLSALDGPECSSSCPCSTNPGKGSPLSGGQSPEPE